MSATALPTAAASANAIGALAVQPYLCFEGRCEEALNFYRDAVGAEVTMMMRFADAPPGDGGGCMGGGTPPPPDKIMHASLRIGGSEIFASDGMANGTMEFKGIALSVAMADDAAADRAFTALAAGGAAIVPLMETFFATRFGIVTDRFGVQWMILVPKPM